MIHEALERLWKSLILEKFKHVFLLSKKIQMSFFSSESVENSSHHIWLSLKSPMERWYSKFDAKMKIELKTSLLLIFFRFFSFAVRKIVDWCI